MNDAEIERIAAEYIAEDWMLDRYYRNMNIIAFAKKLLERGYAEGRAAERIARRSADTDRHGSNELTSSPEPAPSRASGLLPVAREGLLTEAMALLTIYQSNMGSSRAGCFDGDKLRWDRIDALREQVAAIEAAHGIAPASGDAPGEAK